jgi:hypothetical protein
MMPVLPAFVSVVSIGIRGGDDNHPARDAGAMASRGFPLRWKSRNLGGRPPIDADLWPRIHGELLKLGFAGAPAS